MTTQEWSKVLAGMADPEEVRTFLLAIADELPDAQAEILRGLTRRPEGLAPWFVGGLGYPQPFVWFSDRHEILHQGRSCKLPDGLHRSFRLHDHDDFPIKWNGRYFRDAAGAWAALFAALPEYAREMAEESDAAALPD